MAHRPNLLTIAPGSPFLETLVDALLDGRLVPGFTPRGDPLALASATLYLPTRRAIRALRGIFLDRLGSGAALLPLLARHGYGPLPVSFAGKAGTFALLYAFPLLLLAEMPGWPGDVAAVTGWAFTWWGVGLYWLAGAQYVLQTRALVVRDKAATDETGTTTQEAP